MEFSRKNLNFLSFVQYGLAILVILLHCTRIFQNEVAHFIQKSIFSRMAVPFFVVCSAYMIRSKETNHSGYLKQYLKKFFSKYLIWSVIYLPYAVMYYLQHFSIIKYAPLALIVGFLYTGICYHLWYIPAFFLGIFLINLIIKRTNLLVAASLASLLYLVGCIETYSGYLKGSVLLELYQGYTKLFFTTRNGLFYIPIYICIGYILYDYRDTKLLNNYCLQKWLLFFLLFLIEGVFIFNNQGIDKNFFFMLVPYTMFFFNYCIRSSCFKDKQFYTLKKLSESYYFIHPIFVEIFANYILDRTFFKESFGVVLALCTLLSTHFATVLLQKLPISQFRFIGRISKEGIKNHEFTNKKYLENVSE